MNIIFVGFLPFGSKRRPTGYDMSGFTPHSKHRPTRYLCKKGASMKNQIFKTIALPVILIAILLCVPSLCFAQRDLTPRPDGRFITVTGEAEINVVPDKAIITLGASNRDLSVIKSKAVIDEFVIRFTEVAKKYGIKPKDIQTDYINIEPEYKEYHKETFLGYSTHRRFIVTLTDMTKFDSLISDLIVAGATEIENVQFQTSDLRKYRDDARVAAIKAASEKANLLASQLDAKVGKPYDITEITNNWGGWYSGGLSGRYQGSMTSNVSQNAYGQQGQETLSSAIGKLVVKASVRVIFELE
jgi:uncharacterized protein